MAPQASKWQPNKEEFWRHQGNQQTAHFPRLNLLLLLAGACVWMIWAVLTLLMLSAGYEFSIEQYFSLISSAGLAAACVRLGGSFLLHHSGTRYAMMLSVYLIYIPLFFLWWALEDLQTPFWKFQLLSVCTGLGGGLLMQVVNTSYYVFPIKQQPLVQEVPLALANSGLMLVLVFMPVLVQWPGLSWLKSEPLILQFSSSNISGRVSPGTPVWLNTVVWLPSLLLACTLFWLHRLPNIRVDHSTVIQRPPIAGLMRSFMLIILALAGSALLVASNSWLPLVPVSREVTMVLAIGLMLLWIKLLSDKQVKLANKSLEVFVKREVHVLSFLYLAGMGSLLGLAVSFPLLLKMTFSLEYLGSPGSWQENPVAPSVLIYGWLPVVLGLIVRAFGTWLAHRWQASKVIQWSFVVMFITALTMAYYMQQARISGHPEQWFFYFFGWSLLFFIAAGFASGSVMTLILQRIPKMEMEHSLTWIVAITTAGTFYIPQKFADHWHSLGPASVIVGFAFFYLIALAINWYFYLRRRHRT